MIELCTIPKEMFKPFIATVCNFKKEVELNLSPDTKNITLRTVNTENTSLLEMELAVEPKELTSFQIPLGSLEKASPKKDDVTIHHNGLYVVITVDGMKFKIRTLDPRVSGLKPAPTPSINFTTTIELTADDLELINSLFKIVSNYTDNSIFEVKDGKLSISANLTSEDIVEKTIDVNANGPDCKVCIASVYLRESFDNCKIYDSAILSMATDSPLRVEFFSKAIHTVIMIAPRFEDD